MAKALDRPTEGREDRLGELVRAHRGGSHRLPAERGADRGRHPPGTGRVVGRDDRREPDGQPPGVLEDQPAQGAGEGRAEERQRAARGAVRRPARGPRTGRSRRRRRPTGSRATTRPRSWSGGSSRPGACGRSSRPRARAGTTDRARAGDRARPKGSGSRRAIPARRSPGRPGSGGRRLRGVGVGCRRRRAPPALRRRSSGVATSVDDARRRVVRQRVRGGHGGHRRELGGRRGIEPVGDVGLLDHLLDRSSGVPDSIAASAAIASTSAWAFATCASSSRRSISRRTSTRRRGERAGGGLGAVLAAG